jgi:hypothetical protein
MLSFTCEEVELRGGKPFFDYCLFLHPTMMKMIALSFLVTASVSLFVIFLPTSHPRWRQIKHDGMKSVGSFLFVPKFQKLCGLICPVLGNLKRHRSG